MSRTAVVALAALSIGGTLHADEVRLQNGDRLTGTVKSLTAESLVLATEHAGEVKIARSAIASLRTDAPVTVVLADGTRFVRRLEPGDAGTIRFEDGPDAPALPQVPIAQIAEVNPAEKPAVEWTGAATITRGNTRTQSFGSNLDAVRRTADDRLTLGAGWVYSAQRSEETREDELTQRSVFGAAKYDYFVSKRLFGYLQTRAEGDEFQDLELRYTAGVGAGYQWFEEERLKFFTEGGLSFFHEDFEGEEADQFLAARLAYRLDWKPIDDLVLVHNAEWYPSLEDKDDQFARFDFQIRYPFGGGLSANAGAFYSWDNTPAEGLERLDVKYLIGVGYTF
jgi:hypothetical protein